MRIVHLEKAYRELVLDLDPFMMLDRLEFPGTFAYVALDTDLESGDEFPAGLLIATAHEKQLTIIWLYVAIPYRMRGIGEQLLVAAYECAAQMGAVRLGAYLNEEYGRDQICSDEKQYLQEHLFLEKYMLGGTWMTDIRMLAAQDWLRQKNEADTHVVSFRQLNVTQANDAVEELLAMDCCEWLYAVRAKERYYDPDLSFVLLENGRVYGGLLIQRVQRSVPQVKGETVVRTREDVFYPVLCCAQSEENARLLASAALKVAIAKDKYSTEVRVILKSNRYAGLMNRILPGQCVKNYLLMARLEDYLHVEQKDADELEMRRILQLG